MKKIITLFFLIAFNVSFAQLIAIDDVVVGRANSPFATTSGGDRVFLNDYFNGTAITFGTFGNFTITETVPDPSGFLTLNAFGFVNIAASTPQGIYYITYEICENAMPTNCDTAVIEIRIFPSTQSSGSGSSEMSLSASSGSVSCGGNVCITDAFCIDLNTGTIPPLTLSASYQEIGESNTYVVNTIPFNPPFSFGETSTGTALTTDDIWSNIINFAFDFEFYQNNYTNCVLSTNGAVSFDTSNANTFHMWTPAAGQLIPNNTDNALRNGNIFGAIHDTNPAASGTIGTDYNITYSVKGEAPFRVFVFSFYNVAHFSCSALKTSQMIMFYETTNIVETYIFQKPVCSGWHGGRAAIGIQNDAGTQGLAAPGRNTGVWDIPFTSPEAYQFVPSGSTITTFEWLDESGAVIGTDPNALIVTPSQTTTYIAQVTYTDALTGVEYVAIRPITVVVSPTPVVTVTSSADTCSGGDAVFTITGSENDVVEYNINGGATQTITLDATGTHVITITGITANQTINLLTANNLNSICGGPLTLSETVNIVAIPTVTLTSNNSVCSGDNAVFTLVGTPGDEVDYNINSGATQTITLDAAGNGVITISGITVDQVITLENINNPTTGCGGVIADTESVTVTPGGDATFTTTATCDGGTVTITGDAGGIFAFNPVPSDGATINSTTGVVTGGTAGVTYTVEYTTSGACSDVSTETVTVLTTASTVFTTTNTCDGGTVAITGDTGGTFTLNPVPSDGATINSTTGVVTGGTSGATYTIEYTISGACGSSSTENITVLPSENATFTATDTCDGGTVTITGDAGGTFAFNPVPSDGASINSATGLVTGGTPGATYTIEYTTPGACFASSTQNITVLPAEDATFTTTATCDGGTATITGDAGGTFAFNPVPSDGATINSTTGVVTGGTAGVTYTVEYTTSGACSDVSTETVTVLTTASTVFTTTNTCDGGTVAITGDTGGTFTLNPVPSDGATINSTTGVVTGGTSGATYTIEYTISGACGSSSTENITVLPSENATFTATDTCDGGTVTITGDAGGTFAFNPVPSDGASINSATGLVTGGTPGATYTIEYTTPGACFASSTQNITVLPAEDATFTTTATCDGGTATITGDAGGTFAFNPVPSDGATINSTTGVVTGGTAGVTYTVEYTTSGVCFASSTQNITVIPTEDASFTATADCDGGTVTITGDTGGTFAFNPVPSDGASIDPATGTVSGGTSGATYTIEYTTPGACFASSTQNITVQSLPVIVNPSPLVSCDENVIDGMTEMDLTLKDNEITAGNTNYIVTYHNNLADAIAGTPEVTPSSTAYIGTDGEIVYVRVEDINTGCYDTTTLTLNVVTGPPVSTPLPLYDCDEDNDNLGSFDLSPVRDAILATDPTLVVTFHLTLQNALDDVNPQGDSLSNVAGQIIYVRVEFGSGIDCATIVELQLIVEPAPEIPTDIAPYVVCDDDLDGIATFNLTTMDATIYGSQNPANYTLTYHESMSDAESTPSMSPIIEPDLSNYMSGNTTIYVRLEGSNGCVSVGQFDLIVNPLPEIPAEAQDVIFEICDDSSDNDGYAIFDLTTQNDGLTGGDVTLDVNYFETMADIPNNPISDYTAYNNVSIGGLPHNPQTIFVTVTETTSGGNCYSLTSLTLVVNTLPTPNDVLPDLVACDDNNSGDLQEEFDLTQNEGLMLNDFDETVSYHETLGDAELGENPIANATAYANISAPQTIYVRVTNTGDPSDASDEGTGCYTIITFDLIVNPAPEFNIDDLYIICINLNDTEVIGNPTIDTGLSASQYTFQWVEDGDPSIILGTDSIFMPTVEGNYTVTVTNINSLCMSSDSTVVELSSPPTVTATLATEAFANNNIIQVTATGDGAALFEFSIDNGPWLSNEPNSNTYTFNDVLFGEHVIQARDINGCGIASDVVLVMDYPLFFTPNNDGYNDTWKIFGIENQFDAKIFIYDRYGKLLKQLSPTGPGWDGTYNGELLPSSDYWFTIDYRELGESEGAQKQFKAHFSLKR